LDPGADINETAKGDHRAFGRIVAAHQGKIFGYLGRMGFDSATAEDLAQETFLRVWRHAGRFNPRLGSLTTWILMIARNLALTRLSQPERRAETHLTPETMETASDEQPPDAQLLARERHQQVHAALRRLSNADRSLLAASYIEELDLAAVARIEGCSPGAAKVRLHRARQRLRQILEVDDD
jgi:RNA polymerase sigma-70 factor (ECF subfamily)